VLLFGAMGFSTCAIRLALASILLSGLAAVPACGSDEATPKNEERGEAGAGGTPGGSGAPGSGGVPTEITCGANTCEPQAILGEVIPACCAADDACGLDATFLESFGPTFDEACQPRDQPGELDPGCPESAAVEVPDFGLPIVFQGCCRPDVGRCGYMVDRLFGGVLEIGLGCVDSQPFLDGGAAEPCDPNAPGGSGGAAGATGGENASGSGGAG
jgi:hypothetical protein